MGAVATAPSAAAAELHRTALRLRKAGDAAGARAAWRRLLALAPAHHDALLGLGELLLQSGDPAEAARHLGLAARSGSTRALASLAAAQRALGRSAEAIASAEAALAAAPADPDILSFAGALLLEAERFDEAEKLLRRAAASTDAARANLAALLLATDRAADAIAEAEAVIKRDPTCAAAWSTLGAALLRVGRPREAAEAFGRLVALQPASPEAHMAHGMARLRLGDFAAGWREFAWRWKSPRAAGDLRPWNLPAWDGGSGIKRLILFSEQGFGDTLQFCRFAPLLAARGPEVMLEVQPELADLLQHSFAAPNVRVLARPAAGTAAADAALGLLDVPLALGLTIETIPADVPYLHADGAAVARWRARLDAAAPGRRRVGVVWAGSQREGSAAAVRAVDARRSVRLQDLTPLAALDGISLVSLQKGPPAAAAREAPFALIDWTDELRDFADTAALVDALDVVVTVDTAVAHLAGALAKPTLLLSRLDGCWRWLVERDDSPWYPTLRVLRQTTAHRWEEPVARAADLLRSSAPPLR